MADRRAGDCDDRGRSRPGRTRAEAARAAAGRKRPQGGALLRRLVSEPGRHGHALVRLFQSESRGSRDSGGARQRRHAKGVRRPAADGFPAGSARCDRRRGRGASPAGARRLHGYRAGGVLGDVVWTLRYRGQTYSVPGRAKNSAYQLDWPMAMGSVPPLLRFTEGGPAGRGPTGIQASPAQTAVGKPLSLAVWVTDDSVREKEPVTVAVKRERPAMNVNWFKHSGPGPVVFNPPRSPMAQLAGTANTSVTFKAPVNTCFASGSTTSAAWTPRRGTSAAGPTAT